MCQVLNQRLDILKELFDMLSNEMHNNHSNKLEWIVIILIVIEVVFQAAASGPFIQVACRRSVVAR